MYTAILLLTISEEQALLHTRLHSHSSCCAEKSLALVGISTLTTLAALSLHVNQRKQLFVPNLPYEYNVSRNMLRGILKSKNSLNYFM